MVSMSLTSWASSQTAALLVLSVLFHVPASTVSFTASRVASVRPTLHQCGATGTRPAVLRSTCTVPNNKHPKRPLYSSRDSNEKDTIQRPDWACDWMPTWLISMRPSVQFLVGLALYVFHLKVLTQHMIAFPFQLIPNEKGFFQSIGLDSLAGILSLFGCFYLQRSTRNKPKPAVPPLWRGPTRKEAPWRLPTYQFNRKFPMAPGPKVTSVLGMILLIRAYFFTGRFSIFWEDALYAAAGVGFPMTIAMHRSLCVLLGHLTWIFVGGLILKLIPRPQPFFGGGYKETRVGNHIQKRKLTQRWFSSRWDTYWLWWTIGGYFVSSWLFNIADFINQMVLPAAILENTAEGVVSQLINPENNDFAASLVGYIAPCLTAPWWEEILYRGFMLPAMCQHMHYWAAVLLSGIVFSAHHLSATGAIPLAVLGWAWAAIYTKSGNLLVTILIHAMWNSRVFFGSWLGL